MTLWSDFHTNDKRIIHKWMHYFPAYEQHFQRYINRSMVFWEIGCGEGGSLQMWKRFFGPHARIVGLDIRPECMEFEENQISVRIGDQSAPFCGISAKVFEHSTHHVCGQTSRFAYASRGPCGLATLPLLLPF